MEVMTLAQRKAAKKQTLLNSETQGVGPTPPVMSSIQSEAALPIGAQSTPALTTQAQEFEGLARSAAPVVPVLSAKEILELAAKHGLTLQAPKKEFVKHTYSVTTESKALFKKYCDVLGMNMQDAMEESLQDFFKKHALEYSRIKEVRNK